ncbi:phage tail assembly chaperone [Alkalihalobacillus pseudalcaliphilus]|uniref:phage tail assembly chaperone n=1 Tax=Alkalihalobacillus pseudalcaliphilus TaxID=79884 RepID=UPI00064DD47C|nr:phage tail assembly chaperone [Alkalihalobacillus pseudalcaliphilus]KMK75459.1 hypothetical protein AB990_09120 [Alkalihalobacillus pseudalcaliphilus]
MFAGWRYLKLTPDKIYDMTPREFTLLIKAQEKRKQDERHETATYIIWLTKADREKQPKPTDLYTHPDIEAELGNKAEESRNNADWLSQFNFNGKEEAYD